jgi:hypothetical protein
MTVTVRKAVLWRRALENRPGALAEALKPLADARVNLQVVMGYAFPGHPEHAAVEVWPITGAKAEQAAGHAGLAASPHIACLIVTGDDAPGLGHRIADRLAANGINISFVMVQVSGKQYHGVFGFENEEEADRAVSIIKDASKAAAPKRRLTGSRGKASTAAKAGARKGGSAMTTAVGKSGPRKPAAGKSAVSKTVAKKGTARSGVKKSAAKKPAVRRSARKLSASKRSK